MAPIGSAPFRDPIARSWRRAEMAGIDPASAIERISHAAVDHESPLLAAASPVLDDLNAQLAGTMFTTMLADREGRIVHRFCADNRIRRAFDDLGIDVGASLLEEAVGTNAPGTVLETRESISVHGNEHFATALKPFSCYGHPIFHPTTRRIEGVLDLTAMREDASPLIAPLVARAVADIEQRVLGRSRISDRELLAAFQAAAGRRQPVVAAGHDMFISNPLALDLLGTTDVALLRMLALDARHDSLVELTLQSGARAAVRVSRVGGARGGALLQIEALNEAPPPSRTRTASWAPVLVTGPPGSGRSTRARELATSQPVTTLTAASALLDGAPAWAGNFAALVRGRQGTVVIDGVDLLSDALLESVATHVAFQRAPQVILVAGPLDLLGPRAAALASQCTDRHTLDPLSSRLHQLPELVTAMLRSLDADPSVHLTPGALRALATQPWPGGLRELKAVVRHVVRRRAVGGIVIDDLPESYRSREPVRPMARIERAERDAIIAALREHEGNKTRAAEVLGISRTTLYAKMRALRVTGF